ncbi:MAG: AMP-binding protein [Acidimicrobiales bacterium]|nr:AMP-binding protein [Acidimicrobiales bacterium]
MAGAWDYHASGAWRTEGTFLNDFLEVADEQPDAVALVSYRSGVDEPLRLTYGELADRVDRIAGGLQAIGVQAGEVVAVQLPNWWEFPAVVLACARIGAVVNPLVPIFRHRELRFMLARTESRVAISPTTFRGFDHGGLFQSLAAEVDTFTHPFAVGETFEPQFVERTHPLTPRHIGPDDLAEIQFTSGTTGEPKGVVHTPNTIGSAVDAMVEVLGLDSDDVVLMASTLAHQTGFLYGLVMPLSRGMKVVYQDVWDADQALRICHDEGVTFTMGSTTFLLDTVAAQRRAGGAPPPAFRYFVCGGAPIPSPLVYEAREQLDVEVVAVWGMTENGAATLTRPGDEADVVANSDGIAANGMEVRVVDDGGTELPVGTVGRLQVRGPNQTPGYYQRPDLYEACLSPATDDGPAWFDTGDLALRRADGGIRISGRSKDLIIRGGENIPVAEVEGALFGHPKVREVAVVGLPDARLGERACAVVVAEGPDEPTLPELTAYLGEVGMAKQFWPESLVVVNEMPKTPSGTIQKFVLREELSEPATADQDA